jgi:hypothetical protein
VHPHPMQIISGSASVKLASFTIRVAAPAIRESS